MKKKRIGRDVLFAAGMLMLLCSHYFGNRLMHFSDTMSVKYREAGLTASRIDEINSREEAGYLTGWNCTPAVQVQNIEGFRKAEAVLTEVHGDMNAVWPAQLQTGYFAGTEDREGCVVSRALAEELFLDSRAVGGVLLLGEERYVVRGILNSEELLLMIQKDGEGGFSFLELQYTGSNQPASDTKARLSQWGLPAYTSFTEGNLYAGLGRFAMGLPCMVLLLLAGTSIRERILHAESMKTAAGKKKDLLVTAVILLLLLWLVKNSIVFSDDYIPAQISDFAFWPEKLKEVWADYRGIVNERMGLREILIFRNLRYCFLSSAASILLCAAWKLADLEKD